MSAENTHVHNSSNNTNLEKTLNSSNGQLTEKLLVSMYIIDLTDILRLFRDLKVHEQR